MGTPKIVQLIKSTGDLIEWNSHKTTKLKYLVDTPKIPFFEKGVSIVVRQVEGTLNCGLCNNIEVHQQWQLHNIQDAKQFHRYLIHSWFLAMETFLTALVTTGKMDEDTYILWWRREL